MKIITILIWIWFLLDCNSVYAQNLKIAILDNFKYQNYVTTRYKDYYIEGLNVAQTDAKQYKINIEYKIFQYNESQLSIFEQIPKVEAWKPDIIIGPRDSNKFLMLSHYFKGILVLSPFATSTSIKLMPKNFFSMTLDDCVESQAIYQFIQSRYFSIDAVVFSETDCKSCNDVSTLLKNRWIKFKNQSIQKIDYLSGEGEFIRLNPSQLKNKIIIISGTAHDSAVLMARISHLFNTKTIFIGGDGWGAWKDTEVGKLGDINHYEAYHISPWALELNSTSIKLFKHKYLKIIKKPLEDKLSYIIYRTVMSSIVALCVNSGDDVLKSYQNALMKDKFWFKPTEYMVYKIKAGINEPYMVVNIVKNSAHLSSVKQS